MTDRIEMPRSLAEDLRTAANMADWEDPSGGWGDVVKETDAVLSAPVIQKTRIDYEQETPGLTGYYRNIVEYDDIIPAWGSRKLMDELMLAQERLSLTAADMPTNGVRRELMRRAIVKMREEALRRMNQ